MKLMQELNMITEAKAARRVPAGTFTPAKQSEPSKGRDRNDPNWDWKNPNDNPSGKKPEGEQPHKVNGKYNKDNYPIVFDDAEDSVHLFDPMLVREIKKDMGAGEWNKMSELDQIKQQVWQVMLPPTKAQKEWTRSQWDAHVDKIAKRLQSQIKRG